MEEKPLEQAAAVRPDSPGQVPSIIGRTVSIKSTVNPFS